MPERKSISGDDEWVITRQNIDAAIVLVGEEQEPDPDWVSKSTNDEPPHPRGGVTP